MVMAAHSCDTVNAAKPVAVRTDALVTVPSTLRISPAHSLCMGSKALLLEPCPRKACPRDWEPGGAPSLPLSKTWVVTVLLFMSRPCPMSGLEGDQPGPAVWPYLSHVIRCLVAADPSAIWLSGLRVRGGRQPLLMLPLVFVVIRK